MTPMTRIWWEATTDETDETDNKTTTDCTDDTDKNGNKWHEVGASG